MVVVVVVVVVVVRSSSNRSISSVTGFSIWLLCTGVWMLQNPKFVCQAATAGLWELDSTVVTSRCQDMPKH